MSTLLFRYTSGWMLLVTLFLCGCVTDRSATSTKTEGRLHSASISGNSGDLGILPKEQDDFAKALAHYAAGLLDFSKGDNSEALGNWEQVVRLDPTRSELREKVIQEYFRRKDFKKAAEILEIAIQNEPNSFSYLTLLAISYRADKIWDKATDAAERAIRLDRSKFPAYEVLFEIAIELNDTRAAKKILDRAARQKSEDFYFWVRLADLYAALNSREPALGIDRDLIIGYYDKAIVLQPKDPVVLARVADFYVVNQNLPKAIELYQKILEEQPNAENIRLKLALTYVAQNNRKQAIETLEHIVKNEPLRYQIFSLIGELYEDMKDSERALANYRLSISANPNQIAPYLKMVLLEMRSKHLTEALKLLDLAREKFPNTPQISYFYGLAYNESKDYVRAIASMEDAYRAAIISNPEMLNAVFYFYYGAALERSGQYDKAIEQFKKALELNPDYADAYNYLGFMYADRNMKLDEAVQLLEKALAYEPENGAFLDSMGWACYRQGKFEKAFEYLQKAAKLIKDDAVVFEHLGDICLQLGRPMEALGYYQKAVELDPTQREAHSKLNKLKGTLLSKKSLSPPASPPNPASH